MNRNPLITVLVFLVGLAVGYFVRSTGLGAPHNMNTQSKDLAGIEKLHKADADSTLTQDSAMLDTLWSDNAVKLDVPGPPVVGIKALGEMYQKFRVDYPEFKVLKYAPDIKDVQIADGWAIETGEFAATYQMSAKDNPVSVQDKGVRVLKRQGDGSWKFAVVGLK
jgi:ketosteroid isomerase-like protein